MWSTDRVCVCVSVLCEACRAAEVDTPLLPARLLSLLLLPARLSLLLLTRSLASIRTPCHLTPCDVISCFLSKCDVTGLSLWQADVINRRSDWWAVDRLRWNAELQIQGS